MKRDIYEKLVAWKSSSRRKPLLLQGARQTGKTFILKEFGQNEYPGVVYCNFEEDLGLDQLFQRDLNPDRILAELSIATYYVRGFSAGVLYFLKKYQRSPAFFTTVQK